MDQSQIDVPVVSWWNNFFKGAGIPIGLAASFAISFSEHRITHSQIADLDADLLKMIGIEAMGHIMAILKHSKNYIKKTQFGDYNYQNSMQHQSQPDFYQNNNNQSNNNMPYNQGNGVGAGNNYQDKIQARERQLMRAGEIKMFEDIRRATANGGGGAGAQMSRPRRSLPIYIDEEDDDVMIDYQQPQPKAYKNRSKMIVVATGRPSQPIEPKRFKSTAHMDMPRSKQNVHQRANTTGSIVSARRIASNRYAVVKSVAQMDRAFNKPMVKRIGISPVKSPKMMNRVSFDNTARVKSLKDRIGITTASNRSYNGNNNNASPNHGFNNSPKPFKKFSTSPNYRESNVREKFTNFGLNIKSPVRNTHKSPNSGNISNRLGGDFKKNTPSTSHGIFSISPKSPKYKSISKTTTIKGSNVFNRLG